jgi:hypothetical protein
MRSMLLYKVLIIKVNIERFSSFAASVRSVELFFMFLNVVSLSKQLFLFIIKMLPWV